MHAASSFFEKSYETTDAKTKINFTLCQHRGLGGKKKTETCQRMKVSSEMCNHCIM